jgi:hypothetical protein
MNIINNESILKKLSYFHELRLARKWHESQSLTRNQEIKIWFKNGAFSYIGFASIGDCQDSRFIKISTKFELILLDKEVCSKLEIQKGLT